MLHLLPNACSQYTEPNLNASLSLPIILDSMKYIHERDVDLLGLKQRCVADDLFSIASCIRCRIITVMLLSKGIALPETNIEVDNPLFVEENSVARGLCPLP